MYIPEEGHKWLSDALWCISSFSNTRAYAVHKISLEQLIPAALEVEVRLGEGASLSVVTYKNWLEIQHSPTCKR